MIYSSSCNSKTQSKNFFESTSERGKGAQREYPNFFLHHNQTTMMEGHAQGEDELQVRSPFMWSANLESLHHHQSPRGCTLSTKWYTHLQMSLLSHLHHHLHSSSPSLSLPFQVICLLAVLPRLYKQPLQMPLPLEGMLWRSSSNRG